ncbi:MAG: nucleotidyltransferase [Kiritimatiellia bacterium]|jgi:predicted nucleotidyltransferase|nr:nucleotidyltransferase [Kiritimatiellia bacterium]MDP7022737.1 nucleotidyltransferase [Kiritimatiellia bacterium]
MLHKDFRDFLALLAEHKVRHLVVGGYAVAVHGYPRYTGDLAIFIALDPSTAEAVTEAFIDFGFSEADINADTFLIPKSIVEVGHEPLKLHVMNSISGVAFDDAYANRQTVQIDNLDVPFIGYEDLVRNKAATGRGKDRVDIDELARRRKACPPSD